MTSIEWVKNPDGTQGITLNPITGCLNHINGLCKGGGFPCYAYKLANTRLKQRYLANKNTATDKYDEDSYPFYPRFWEERLAQVQRGYHYRSPGELHPSVGAAPRGIFVCDMGDLFGIGIPEQWTRQVLDVINEWDNEVDRFYLLTKQPQNLIKFSPLPENCWVGVTATNLAALRSALVGLTVIKAKMKYISFEPLLEEINIHSPFNLEYSEIQWLIIGACTGTYEGMKVLQAKYPELTLMSNPDCLNRKLWTAQPRIEWVREIVEAADKAGVKVFLKNNLKPLMQEAGYRQASWAAKEWVQCKYPILRQEMPEIKDS